MLELFMDVGKLVDINDEKKGLARHLQLNCTACLCSHTFFSSKRIWSIEEKQDDKNFTMWMLDLFMDVEKLVDIRN